MNTEAEERYLRLAQRCDRKRVVPQPDGYARHTGDCGDTVELFLMAPHGTVEHVLYETNGCLSTNACANALADLIEDQPAAECWQISPESVITYLQCLPPEQHHCAELVVGTLHRALADLQANTARPWQKLYRKQR